jgi:hypothetical protein
MKKSNSPKKIKRYRLGVSRNFPTTHPRAGQPTNFVSKITAKLKGSELVCDCGWHGDYSELVEKTLENGYSSAGEQCFVGDDRCPECGCYAKENNHKIHTCRANYSLWEKRMKEVQEGRAVIELFYWSGKPYNSPQVVFATLDKDSGCGVQELDMSIFLSHSMGFVNFKELTFSGSKEIDIKTLAKNDGLSLEDFKAWFKGYDLNETMAIIHFTSFRY